MGVYDIFWCASVLRLKNRGVRLESEQGKSEIACEMLANMSLKILYRNVMNSSTCEYNYIFSELSSPKMMKLRIMLAEYHAHKSLWLCEKKVS